MKPLIFLVVLLLGSLVHPFPGRAAEDDAPKQEEPVQTDQIIFRSGTVLSGEIVEGTKSLIDDPNWYEILLPNGTLVSVQDTGQVERVIMDGEVLEDPWKHGGRMKLHKMLSEHQKKREALEKEKQRERMTAVVQWILGDVNKGKAGSNEFVRIKKGDRIYPGERVELNPASRIRAKVAGRIVLGMEETTSVEIRRIENIEAKGKENLLLDLNLERGALWLEILLSSDRESAADLRFGGLRMVTTEGLLRVEKLREGGYGVLHYAGPEFRIERQAGDESVPCPPQTGFIVTKEQLDGSEPFRPKRTPLGDYNDWLEFTEWTPAEYDLPIQFELVGKPQIDPYPVEPLIGLPEEKFVFQDLQPIRVTGLAPRFATYRRGLRRFHQDVGRFPTTEEGLESLKTAPPGAENWNGPYIPEEDSLSDPWGQPFRYSIIEAGEQKLIDLYSVGANGIDEQGLGDDLR